MDERDIALLAVMLPALIIVGGVVVMVWGIRHATRQAELQHAERMAMIERGLPPPESPRGSERARRAHGFKMSLGILMCGLGLGLVMLIAFAAGAPATGAGIGGAIVMVGIAFIVSAIFTERPGPAHEHHDLAHRGGGQGTRVPPPVPPLGPPPPSTE